MSEIQDKIKKQVEFYFSDSNLPNDRFLRSLVANHPEGYVSIDTIASFKRMQQITKDKEEVIKALKSSSMLEVDADNAMVRRTTPLPEQNTQEVRTVYVKGFPVDAAFEDLEAFFAKQGDVKAVRMRRYKQTKDFKGSVFVEFATEEEASKFAEVKDLKYKDTDAEPLVIKKKQDYSAEKDKQRQEQKEQKKNAKFQEQIDAALKELKYDEGSLLHIANIGMETPVGFKEIKDALKEFNVAYVDIPYEGDATQAMLRFTSPDAQKKAVEFLTVNKTKLGGNEPTLKTPAGDEERKFYEKLVEKRVKDDMTKPKGGKGGKGGKKNFKGGKGGKRGEKRKTEGDSEQPAKEIKQE